MSAVARGRRLVADRLRRLGLAGVGRLAGNPAVAERLQALLAAADGDWQQPDPARASLFAVTGPGGINWVVLADGGKRCAIRLRLDAGASGNIIYVGHGSDQPRAVHCEGSGNTLLIGDAARWCVLDVRFVSSAAVVAVGRGSIFNGTSIIAEGDGCGVTIGEGGLFAPGTTIRNSDLHGLYALDDDRWLNPPAPVVIEPYVWFGQDALVLKGAHVGGGSVVAARSVVMGTTPRFAVVAGTPARPLRTGVCWALERTPNRTALPRIRQLLGEPASAD
ncbi:hypothetical protein CAP39_11380 [Sphingomonas sp. IBVSS1]|nr:hypothetical protein CAP39_11380 [Sphingomonas sp. IBVSS1]